MAIPVALLEQRVETLALAISQIEASLQHIQWATILALGSLSLSLLGVVFVLIKGK